MQIGNMLKVGLAVLTAPLLKINIVNSLVDRMTGGRINRDTLAMQSMRSLGSLIGAYFSRGLHERSAHTIPYQPRHWR